uniref:Glutaredoxin domain-containing protein n=1 Tax=Chromera velia CCMP2878 TaxID=1169474 RepID=A0A0G4GUZ4_9ALVE|mmetsp:Transcript_54061/g.105772  ORF Transcript_54061/g.105772 Transcript_54061/m.105772 type:complete len:199 (+) Transcript_54061:273-869(+)|eukprot:Cvel_5254.t1-p1 / transcript=Cvel_5254.t1 / gene=Cvel_5254 / organism=Chromera_velia_CCMP2878 / gene_product=hypothetical protein / transcript_product=hypothetical protein / location=Cvel_scaffold242:64313-67297(-) / protein_length=198 / sequence_SO=supercontig / SO=protein_coding / is_pseudo=false
MGEEGTLAAAEVVLIMNSFRSNRRAFHDSLRLRKLLDWRLVDYIVVDINSEMHTGETQDRVLLEHWKTYGVLRPEPGTEGNSGRCMTPQVLFDGISVGGLLDVQDLEEEDLLDGVIDGQLCPSCQTARTGSTDEQPNCEGCGAALFKLVPREYLAHGAVMVFRAGQRVNEEYQEYEGDGAEEEGEQAQAAEEPETQNE